ncbi:DUF302 domain-containing protein [Litorisediminicola beolgyonensis]|uniref:DUF302 domain-containing protein n=1 Tax=Litorisediminicola beolgyonensis TaxID=1173614 RepID=A0ABW3ZEH1_9RHOB
MTRILALVAVTLLAAPAGATDTASAAPVIVSYDSSQSFDDVIFGLENAILGQGLVVDTIHHVGEMLDRTREDVGSTVVIFDHAEVYSFCSAALSRKVMEADPMNVAFCPYNIFVSVRADAPGVTTIGYRSFPEGQMKEVEALLDTIVRNAIGKE